MHNVGSHFARKQKIGARFFCTDFSVFVNLKYETHSFYPHVFGVRVNSSTQIFFTRILRVCEHLMQNA